jgi:methylated-DNA-[protein]-cysteine S-methyltransferase
MLYTEYQSPIGKLLLVVSDYGLAGVYFEEHKHFKGKAGWLRDDHDPLLQETREQLTAYFAGERREFDLPLDLSHGTAFQQSVWKALRTIAFGTTTSYLDIAKCLGNPGAVRAVGAANGRNPISIIVPCHRVIASSGALTGYAGGLEMKMALLALEVNSM